MPDLPFVGVTAIIAGMAAFNADAANVESRLLRIGLAANRLEQQTEASGLGAAGAFGTMAAAVATGATLVVGAMALAGGAAIKFAADFQQGLALTQALTGATDAQMQQLTGTIDDLSRHGTISMDDLAKASTELARSGIPIEAVMNGALKAVQDLTIASGGEIGLEKSAKLTATAMNAFGLSVGEVDRITTSATVVAQNSALTFSDFGTAIQYAGAPAHALGFTIEDLATGFALLGKNGLTGSVAATALRNIFLRLEKPSKDAATVMKQYGINLFDAHGNALPFRNLLEQLNNAFGDQVVAEGKITEEQRAHALATLFLTRAENAALILTKEGTEGFDAMRATFENLKASDLVDILLKPLNSQLQIAWNNVVALGIAFGSQFLPVLQQATAGVVAFLQSVSSNVMVDFGQAVVNSFLAVGAALGRAVDFVRRFAAETGLAGPAVEFLKTALIGLGAVVVGVLVPPMLVALAAFGEFILIVGAVAMAVRLLADPIASIGHALADWVSQFGPVGVALGGLLNATSTGLQALGALLAGDFPRAADLAGQALGTFGDTVRDSGGQALDFLGQKLDEIGAMWAPWAAQAGPAGDVVSNALSGVHGVVQALAFLLQGNFPAASAVAQTAMDNFAKAVQPVADALNGAFKTALDWIASTGWPAVQAASQVAADTFNSVVVPAFDSLVSKVQGDVIPALQGFATNAVPIVQTALDNFGTGLSTLQTAFQTLLDKLRERGAFDDLGEALTRIKTASDNWFTGLGNLGQALLIIITPILGVIAALGRLITQHDNTDQAVEGTATKLKGFTLAFDIVAAGLEMMSESWVMYTAQVLEGVQTIAAIIEFLANAYTAFSGQTAASLAEMSASWSAFTSGVGEAVSALASTIGSALNAALAAVQGWVGSVVAAVQSMAGAMLAAGAAAGQAAVDGLLGGLRGGIGAVTSAAASLAQSALASAKAALGASSPSKEFQQLGEDSTAGLVDGMEATQSDAEQAGYDTGTTLDQGLIAGLDAMKRQVRGTAASVVDEAVNALTDLSGRADQLMTDLQASLGTVGENVGKKINDAIVAAASQISDAVDAAQRRISDLNDAMAQSRSDRGRRDTLKTDQDRRREERKLSEEDADAAAKHQKDLDNAQVQHKQDLDKAQAKHDLELAQGGTAKRQQQIADALVDERAAADLKYRQKLDDLDREFAASEATRMANRQRQQDDAQFEVDLAKETQDLNDKLEEEALARSIDRAVRERDARVDNINQALAEKEKKIREDGETEIKNLENNVKRRLGVLEDEFAKKAADVLRKGGENMQPLVDNIQAILSGNFEAMARSAEGFANSVADAIGQLKRLEEERAKASFQAPDLPSPVQDLTSGADQVPTDINDVVAPEDIPEFAHGGVVPGPWGKPVLAIVHGGEFIGAMHTEIARWARQMSMYNSTANRVYNYNVNASYANTQSPATVELDMRALVALSRTS